MPDDLHKIPMVLSRIRIRGVGDVVDTIWFDVGKELTCILLPQDFNRAGFLQALQTIKPPYDCMEEEPFKDYPRIIRQGKYQKRVRPHRRTIAFGIFTAQPELVLPLSEITPHLYETDRIEVGRRMNHTRWINFVEIASSTRWSEVDFTIQRLIAEYPEITSEKIRNLATTLSKTDRVKDEIRHFIKDWLNTLLKSSTFHGNTKELEELIFAVQRQTHFDLAKEVVQERLPYFFVIDKGNVLKEQGSFLESDDITVITQYMENLINEEEKAGNSNPIFLVDEPSFQLNKNASSQLQGKLEEIAQQYQCICLCGDDVIAYTKDNVKYLTLTDMFAQ